MNKVKPQALILKKNISENGDIIISSEEIKQLTKDKNIKQYIVKIEAVQDDPPNLSGDDLVKKIATVQKIPAEAAESFLNTKGAFSR